MPKAFSVLSWNVEHFGAATAGQPPKKPVGPIIDKIAAQNADIVAIYEVEGATVFSEVTAKMPNYSFHITEGPQTQEILIGHRKTLTAFFTQKVEFRSGVTVLRPGAVLTVTVSGVSYCLLFLHLKSLTDPRGFGLRDDQTERALKFRKVLENSASASDAPANYIFMGDLNTMGMNLSFSTKDLSPAEELERLKARCPSRKLTVLDKSEPATYWPGSTSSIPPTDLDHVVASDHLKFKSFGGVPVSVRGWPQEPTPAKKDKFAAKFSDHAMLFFELQKL
jgi:endonuclease/exonuclease/phosphatase family metal-dependent hydrolase